MDLQLHRITRLVRDYHAILPWKAIHIAGTNGKGTTAAFLSAFLHGKGINVGRFNSPHLKYRHDCIVLNEQTVDKDHFLEVEKLVKRRDADGKIGATSFELLTATAFEIFAQRKVQVAVVECGLGGRLDATNILTPEEVLCSAITRISLDHQDMLGNTLEKIAAEKAGITKKGVPLVVDRNNHQSVRDVLKAAAASNGSPYHASDEHVSILGKEDFPEGISSQENLATATKVYEIVGKELDLEPLNLKDLRRAIATVKRNWQGRLQWVDLAVLSDEYKEPRLCLVDGAHNREGAARLREFLDRLPSRQPSPATWILGMSSGKDVREIMTELVRENDRVVVCAFDPVDGMPWVKPYGVQDLESVATPLTSKPVIAMVRPVDAIRAALAATTPDELVVIAGSLYLVGHVLRDVDAAAAAAAGSVEVPQTL
ncbi:putative dihydrofolate synthetase [Cyphellophora attinorum]|uniref:Dihydrofolate synthetase n=1 Tax=Cyphellophora attinorum TaxID=1664694 RepID=A0A0N1P0Y2_9EURO|nr:putative dihydrofolate synthetase [Phialophora attinorum]KPI41194.1 putative dihydrofolate synthetase [Phialophora attinorum]